MSGPRPWESLYDPGQPATLVPDHGDILAAFRTTRARLPDAPAVHYFDSTLSFADLDKHSDALAALLMARGFAAGDRLALFLQNVPHFLIALLAAWKAGGIAVPINAMNRSREVTLLFQDCTPAALIAQDDLYSDVIAGLDPASCPLPKIVFTSSPFDFQGRNDERVLPARGPLPAGDTDLLTACLSHRGAPPRPMPVAGDDPALIVYTSGTTGVPKGALITHHAVVWNAQIFRDWIGITPDTPILGIAPLFHITGLVGHVALGLLTGAPLILAYRFDPHVVLDTIIEWRPVFSISAITALIALLNLPHADAKALASVRLILSGGAPVPPAVVEQFRARFGHTIRTAYGLTETAAPTHLTPMSRETPAREGVLSIGIPVPGVECRVVDEEGRTLPPGAAGEIVLSAPSVSPGYWRKPVETAEAMRADGFRTGDIGFMDEAGWFYLIDRKKDMIISSGYKVWPREVEDVLYTHPAVREAAVVPAPDAYRGETVRAVISLKPGVSADPDSVIAFCRERMAAYKYPRIVDILDELPKTPSGKILRRELR